MLQVRSVPVNGGAFHLELLHLRPRRGQPAFSPSLSYRHRFLPGRLTPTQTRRHEKLPRDRHRGAGSAVSSPCSTPLPLRVSLHPRGAGAHSCQFYNYDPP
jgi:hypothetical protein